MILFLSIGMTIVFSNVYAQNSLASPVEQLRSGVQVKDVKCKENFVLVIRESNEHPACVNPTSIVRLLSHGWITSEKFVTAHHLSINNSTKNTTAQENTGTISKNITNHIELVTPLQNQNNITINNNATNQTYYPVYQVQRAGTVKVSDLPPIQEIPPPPAVSTTPLTQITEPTMINYSNPNATKILSVGMSPNPLKVGDNQHFTVTYQNISGKPLYGFAICGWNLSKVVSSANVQVTLRNDLPTCSQGDEVIEPNQIITEEAGSYYYYNIMQSGLVHVTLTLKLSNSPYYHVDNIDTIQFNETAAQ